MTLYIGVDFHPHQQMLAWCDEQTGETQTLELHHDLEKVREFYSSLAEPAVIGIEASTRALWFEKMISETGHTLLVGNPVLIRKSAPSRHKNDRRDAEHMLKLLLRGEFPAIWRRPQESSDILDVLRLRHRLVRQRTQVYNRLQRLAHDIGMPKSTMRALGVQQMLKRVEMNESGTLCREHLFSLLDHLNERISELEKWLKPKAAANKQVQLVMTQKGVGYLTGLTFVHTIGDVSRFEKGAKGATHFAGYDSVEDSSAGRKRFGPISKAGSPLLRFQLGQAAETAIRVDARMKAFYKRLVRRKPKALAKTAAARRLLVKLTIMLRDNITAEEFDRRGSTVGNARNYARSEMTAA
jgi:transposase